MGTVDKRRRERIRAKQARLHSFSDEVLEPSSYGLPRPKNVGEGHVSMAPGKQARQRRRRHRLDKSSADELLAKSVLGANPAAAQPASAQVSLSKKRELRRRDRLRRSDSDPNRPETRVWVRGAVWLSWRWLSGSLSIMMVVILYAMLASDVFIVDAIGVGGERYLSPAEVFEAANIANTHLFWIDPLEIEARLESNPSIADAQVFIGWPPNMVSIFITERDPALIWEQENFRVWVDVNGTVMFQRQERPDLLRIVYPEGEGIPGVGTRIDREVITGALQLKTKFPTIDVLLYDDVKGLGYRDGRNWIVWFGTGANMEMKVLVYEAIVRANFPAIQLREVDVSDPDHPTFCCVP